MYRFQIGLTVTVVFTLSCVLANNNDIKDGGADRGAHSDRGGLWFGPRLGKRSLRLSTEDNRQAFFRLLEAADALKYYYEQLPYEMQADEPENKVTKKVIFTPKLGRSLNYDDKFENVEFTPRLGRRVADDMPATPSDQDTYRSDPEQIDSRTKYFSPRLGRTMNFSPRLGRELAYGLIALNAVENYVLLAGDMDDLRNIAKKFVPESLASYVADASAASLLRLGTIKQGSDQENQSDREDDKDKNEYSMEGASRQGSDELTFEMSTRFVMPTVVSRTVPKIQKNIVQHSSNNTPQIILTLDEIVEKVKERLQDEFLISQHQILKERTPNQLIFNENDALRVEKTGPVQGFQSHVARQPLEENQEEIYEDNNTPTKPVSHVERHPQLKQQKQHQQEQQHPQQHQEQKHQKQHQHQQEQQHQQQHHHQQEQQHQQHHHQQEHQQHQQQQQQHQHQQEQHRTKKIFNTTPPNSRYDNYQESHYIQNRSRAQIIHQHENPARQEVKTRQRLQKPKQMARQDTLKQSAAKRETPENEVIYEPVDLKHHDSYDEYVIPVKDSDYVSDEETTTRKLNAKHKPSSLRTIDKTTIAVAAADEQKEVALSPMNENTEYVDVDGTTDGKTSELKARTENLSLEEKFEETPADSNVHSTTETTVKGKPITKRFGTMIPTREYYKQSSPNYYAKIPVVAEKYNFNEPIPEKDREPENLKPIGQPPANINGKIVLL